jgi:hypothetical protein
MKLLAWGGLIFGDEVFAICVVKKFVFPGFCLFFAV